MASNFTQGQFVGVRDMQVGKVYRAKIVEVDNEKHSVNVHYVGWNARYDVVPLSSLRTDEWQSGRALTDATSATAETPLNVTAVPGRSKWSVARDGAGHVLLGSLG